MTALRHLLRPGWVCLGLLGWLACGSTPTALVLEVENGLPAGALERVSFRVEGPGLEPAGRSTVVPVVGQGAQSFPLRLTLVHGGAAMGPLRATIEGEAQGARRARVADLPPLYFERERIITHHFVLRGLDQPPVPGAGPTDAGAADAAPPVTTPPTPADAAPGMTPPTTMPPLTMPPAPPPPADAAPPPPPRDTGCPAACDRCGDDKDCRKECKKLGCCKGKCAEGGDQGEQGENED
jgi:hypothetical protein